MADAKPHISPTQLASLSRCAEAYRRRYIEGEKIPPAIAMLKGSGVHGGAATNFRQKIESHEDLPAREIVDAAVATFENELRGGFSIDAGEGSPSVAIARAKDGVAALAQLHAVEVAPDYQPVLVEQPVRLILPNSPRDLYGIIDLADDKRRVVDHKTSGKKKRQAEADTSVQLTYYAAAHEAFTGKPASDVRLKVLVESAVPERQTLVSDRNAQDFEAPAHRVNAFLKAVEAGSFPPTNPDNWWCHPRWCGYWSSCRFVNHSRPMISLPQDDDDDDESTKPEEPPAPFVPAPVAQNVLAMLNRRGRPRNKAFEPIPALDKSIDLAGVSPAEPTNRLRSYKAIRETLFDLHPFCHWCKARLTKLHRDA